MSLQNPNPPPYRLHGAGRTSAFPHGESAPSFLFELRRQAPRRRYPAVRGNLTTNRNYMNFFDKIHETQITRRAKQPFQAFVPLHRRLFAVDQSQRDIARAAVREVLG